MIDLDEARCLGPAASAALALSRLRGRVDSAWLHLDADVLDDAVMPAVDSREPGGLAYPELVGILRALLGSGRIVGMDITIYDPDLDPTGDIARRFAAALVQALSPGV